MASFNMNIDTTEAMKKLNEMKEEIKSIELAFLKIKDSSEKAANAMKGFVDACSKINIEGDL